MAYKLIPQYGAEELLYVADSDSDVSTINSENPSAPDGSIIIANNSGSTAVHMKFPAGWSKIGE